MPLLEGPSEPRTVCCDSIHTGYDNGNQLTLATDVSGSTTSTYDNNGNQLTIEEPSGDITTNTWDGENRLVQVEHPSADITTYAYNADGLRVMQDDGVAETHFVYDGNNLLQETDDVGTTEAEFTYVPQAYAELISQRRSGDSSFYQFDGIKNVRQLTDGSQVVTDEYDFDAWGSLRSSTGSTLNANTWQGQWLAIRKDPNAGPELQYAAHFRQIDNGRFTSPDPAKKDLNLYRCDGNNPVNRADPSGLEDKIDPRAQTLIDAGVDPNDIVFADRQGRITSGMGYFNMWGGWSVHALTGKGSNGLGPAYDSFAETARKRGYVVIQDGELLPRPPVNLTPATPVEKEFKPLGLPQSVQMPGQTNVASNPSMTQIQAAAVFGVVMHEFAEYVAKDLAIQYGTGGAGKVTQKLIAKTKGGKLIVKYGGKTIEYAKDKIDDLLEKIAERLGKKKNAKPSADEIASYLNGKDPSDLTVKWTEHGGKHVPPKNASWNDVMKGTKSGPAKYHPDVDIESLERSVYAEGTPVTSGRSWKVQEFPEAIGASEGKSSRWIRVEESAGVIHGHPITYDEFRRLTKAQP